MKNTWLCNNKIIIQTYFTEYCSDMLCRCVSYAFTFPLWWSQRTHSPVKFFCFSSPKNRKMCISGKAILLKIHVFSNFEKASSLALQCSCFHSAVPLIKKCSVVSTVARKTGRYLQARNPHLNFEGGRITYWFDLLSQQDLLVRNQLHLCM